MFKRYRINPKELECEKLEIISGFIMKTTGKTIDVDMKRFCIANIFFKITSKYLMMYLITYLLICLIML